MDRKPGMIQPGDEARGCGALIVAVLLSVTLVGLGFLSAALLFGVWP